MFYYYLSEAFFLSFLSIVFSIFMSIPLFMVTELHLSRNILNEDILSYCYEVELNFLWNSI